MQVMPSKNLAVPAIPLLMPYIQRRPELEGITRQPFKLVSDYKPAGDQPEAIKQLISGVEGGERDQVLLGVTGSGKTFTMANVIASQGRPALVMAPNKTLAAQLYSEMKGFFPENAVEYFVSYYDYYQPEAYVPRTDTFIEKDSSINEQIDRMRHSATRALMERDDVIIVASVSCIYGIGPLENYQKMTFRLHKGQKIDRTSLLRRFVEQQYKRNDNAFQRGSFRVRGDTIDILPAHYEEQGVAHRDVRGRDRDRSPRSRSADGGDDRGRWRRRHHRTTATAHYITQPSPTLVKAVETDKAPSWQAPPRPCCAIAPASLLEAQRLESAHQLRHRDDARRSATCAGIENYSRLPHRPQVPPASAPACLFDYFPEDFPADRGRRVAT